MRSTYSDNGRVIGDLGRIGLVRGAGRLLDSQILHIAATEDNIIVDLVRRRDLLIGRGFPAFGAERSHALEGDSRLFRVNLMEDTRIPSMSNQCRCPQRRVSSVDTDRMSLLEINDMRELARNQALVSFKERLQGEEVGP